MPYERPIFADREAGEHVVSDPQMDASVFSGSVMSDASARPAWHREGTGSSASTSIRTRWSRFDKAGRRSSRKESATSPPRSSPQATSPSPPMPAPPS